MPKYFIKGIEVKVGQVWKDSWGGEETIIDFNEDSDYPIRTTVSKYTRDGYNILNDPYSNNNLTELVAEPATSNLENQNKEIIRLLNEILAVISK